MDRNIEWDTDKEEDKSCTPSPTTVIEKPTQSDTIEETPPVRQNRCLVSEHVIEPRVVLPREPTPVTEEGKTPQDESPPQTRSS